MVFAAARRCYVTFVVDELLRGHGHFRRDYLRHEGDFLRRLASEGQTPAALFVGCSDSRVVPEILTAAAPGELFVVRNVANLVPPFAHPDASVGAALEYAVGVLQVPHLVVCGHDGCGGVEAMLDGGRKLGGFASLSEWLGGVTPAVERARDADRTRWWRRAVEENVLEQLGNVTSFPLARAALERGDLELHGWVYDLGALELRVYDADEDRFRPASEVAARKRALTAR